MLEDFRLKVFEAVVQTGSFTKAALLLDVSQPAVSQNIAELERIAGYSLFQRSYGKVELTPEGIAFKSYADKILMWYRAAGETFRKDASLPVRLQVGVPDDLSAMVAVHVLSSIQAFYQDLVFDVHGLEVGNDLNFRTLPSDLPHDEAPSSALELDIRPVMVCQAAAIAGLGQLSSTEDLLNAGVRLALWSGYEKQLPLELQPFVRLQSTSANVLKSFVQNDIHAAALLPELLVAEELASRSMVLMPSAQLPANVTVRLEPSPEFEATPLYRLAADALHF